MAALAALGALGCSGEDDRAAPIDPLDRTLGDCSSAQRESVSISGQLYATLSDGADPQPTTGPTRWAVEGPGCALVFADSGPETDGRYQFANAAAQPYAQLRADPEDDRLLASVTAVNTREGGQLNAFSLDRAIWEGLLDDAGVAPPGPDTGYVLFRAIDSGGNTLEGATLEVAGAAGYFTLVNNGWTLGNTTTPYGYVLAYGVPGGPFPMGRETTIKATGGFEVRHAVVLSDGVHSLGVVY